jgi:hypothetical protein
MSPSEGKDGTVGEVARHCNLRMAYMLDSTGGPQRHTREICGIYEKRRLCICGSWKALAVCKKLPRRVRLMSTLQATIMQRTIFWDLFGNLVPNRRFIACCRHT